MTICIVTIYPPGKVCTRERLTEYVARGSAPPGDGRRKGKCS